MLSNFPLSLPSDRKDDVPCAAAVTLFLPKVHRRVEGSQVTVAQDLLDSYSECLRPRHAGVFQCS